MLAQVRIDGKKLKRFREEADLTQGQLAIKTGITQSHISLMERGKRPNVTLATVGQLAKALEKNIDELLVKGERPSIERKRTLQEIIYELENVTPILVPITAQPAAAGYGLEAAPEYLPFMPEPSDRRHKFIGVEIRGDCLVPRIRPGEYVIVDTDASPREGDVVLAVHDGEIIVKLLERRNDDTYLIALRKRPPLKVNEDTRILGIVRMVMRRP